MSTNPKADRKKARCKMDSPICNDRAEAFVGPRPEILPKFFEVPSEWDAKAFDLSAKGMTQRQIAKELKTSQSTVHRAIKKYRFWFGTTLPEDRGELIGWARFRVAVEERRIFLRHQQELAMEEWHQTRKPVKVKRKRTKLDPKGRKKDGMPIKDIQIEEYVQRRHASAAHMNAAAKRSLELTMLEAGYLGVNKLSCDRVMDVDERDRWDRAVKSYQATIEELTRRVTELEGKLAAVRSGPSVFGMCDSPLPSTPQPKTPDPLARQPETSAEPGAQPRGTGVFGGCVFPLAQPLAPKTPDPGPLDESRTAQLTPAVHQNSLDSQVASPVQNTPCGDRPDSPPPLAQRAESDESRAPSGVGRGSEGPTEHLSLPTPSPKIPEPEPYDESVEFCATRTPKWNSRHRQEALDYYCMMHGIPPLELHQVTGIPDPKSVSPKMALERGYPYHILIDRSIPSKRPPVRDKRKVITVW